uniref:Dihydrolipoamide acetyltransferase component of pyruvate dehydrogenase complex n=1 Tax=Roseihalotalea indica TaxID=2867963 RepID=A0AA49GRU5_9BACT|nr:2-oxo acid dehydrogenase subunit E2 [Tunicatimonas sp. TK19036]
MTKDIKMPKLSEDAESGTIVEILVQEGDEIEEEQSIVAVESDKASVEVPSPEAGTVKKISISEGDELSVGDVILTLEIGENGKEDEADEDEETEEKTEAKKKDKEGEEGDEEEPEDEIKEKPKSEKEKKDDSEESDEEDAKAEQKEEKNKKEKPQESAEDVPAAPSVRRLSRELEVDIHQIDGSGPGGRITAEDVKAYAEKGSNGKQDKSKKQPASTELPDFNQWGTTEREKLSSIRRITAESMSNAWQTVPHVTQFDQADVTELEKRQEAYEKQAEKSGGKLTLTATLLKVTAAALRAFPKFNASIDLDNEEVILKQYYHIGIAVDTEQGLLVPVIRDVNKKSVVELSVELPDIAEKAREGKLSSDEMQGGTFTISNLGGIGGTNFTPIVYHPQVAILGVSRTQIQPVYVNDSFEPRSILPLSLSYDHRLIDGAEAARFLRWICRALEDPMVALMEG